MLLEMYVFIVLEVQTLIFNILIKVILVINLQV